MHLPRKLEDKYPVINQTLLKTFYGAKRDDPDLVLTHNFCDMSLLNSIIFSGTKVLWWSWIRSTWESFWRRRDQCTDLSNANLVHMTRVFNFNKNFNSIYRKIDNNVLYIILEEEVKFCRHSRCDCRRDWKLIGTIAGQCLKSWRDI